MKVEYYFDIARGAVNRDVPPRTTRLGRRDPDEYRPSRSTIALERADVPTEHPVTPRHRGRVSLQPGHLTVLEARRRYLGLSQQLLAHLSGVGQSAISGAERGVLKLSAPTSARLARVLDVPPDVLLQQVEVGR